jgi:alkylated DNA repair dioxygenase AlkB
MEREYFTENSWLDTGFLHENLKPSHETFTTLYNLHPKERGIVNVFGEKQTPRYQQSYLRDYSFSGNVAKSLPLPNEFQPYLDFVNNLGYGEFNQVLLNWYSNGHHYIGTHADSEKELIPDSPIVTISLGAERTFRIRNRDKKVVKDVITKNGIILVMGGKFQKEFKHEIVKINGKKGEKIYPRISLTFRQFI